MTQPNLRPALLLDEHPLWLDAVEAVLRGVRIEVVAKSSDPEAALALVAELRPSLCVTEIDFPHADSDGITFLRRVRIQAPETRALVLAQREEAETIGAALAAGATAYVVKRAHPDDLAAAVRQAFEQSLYFASTAPRATSTPSADGIPLTRRELEILRLAAEGRSNAQLDRALWVSEQTVKFHHSNVYRTVGVSNRIQAARWAQLHGLVGFEQAPSGLEETAPAAADGELALSAGPKW